MNKEKIQTIGIDARFYGPIGKGLGRYTQEVVDKAISLFSLQDNIRFVIFLSPENFTEFECDGVKVKKVLIKARWYTLVEQLELPYRIFKERISLMHFPHFNVPIFFLTPFVVTIHDLILTKFPTTRSSTLHPLLYWLKDKAYRLVIYSAINRAKNIITVSNFTKDDLVNQFKVNPKKITVTYEGVADIFKTDPVNDAMTILQTYNISKPYLLYVGNAYPHKNLEGLIKAFIRIKDKHPELTLVLVGKQDYFYERVKEFAASQDLWQEGRSNNPIVFPGYVPDVDLHIFFQEAILYIFPSMYEGFGLPPLEAMAHGCPVVSSNKASMPEILGKAAAYFNPENEEEILKTVEEVLQNKQKRQEMIRDAYEVIKKYSWEDCARQTVEIYQKILNQIK